MQHQVTLPVGKGMTICSDFSNSEYETDEWYKNFKKQRLNSSELFVYSENSTVVDTIPFEALRAEKKGP